MFLKVLVLIVLVVSTYSESVCNKFSLSSIDALVYKQKNGRAIYLEQESFNLLDGYISIDITKANVSMLCEGMIENFLRLETLTLINLNLTLIEPETFRNVPKLKHLSLSVNRISLISNGTFNLITNLQVLYLSKNEIRVIEEGAFSNMHQLKAIHLEHNQICELSGNMFTGSPKVSFLDFSYNYLKQIRRQFLAEFQPAKTVAALHIFLKKNNIADIDEDFLKVRVPVNVHLEHNQLTVVPPFVNASVGGSKLYLDNNNIKCVDNILEKIINEDIVVNVKYNPIECECMSHINDIITLRELKGELNIESTLFCIEIMAQNTNNII